VIQGKHHQKEETKRRWLQAINEKLTIDKITATRIKRNQEYTKLVINTWEKALEKEEELPPNWIVRNEILVGRTARHTHNHREHMP